jgi:hypothetical protein
MLKRIALLGFFFFSSAATFGVAAPHEKTSAGPAISAPTAPSPQGICPNGRC